MTKASSQDEILIAAARIFRDRGYGAATTREIAQAAGLLLGSLTYRYPSKHEILAAVSERGMERSLAICERAIREISDPVQALRDIFKTHLRILTAETEEDSIYVLLYEWRALTGASRERVISQRDEYEAMWDQLLRDAAREGAVSSGVDLKMLRILFMSAANWSPQWFRPSDRLSADEVSEALFTLIWNGVASTEATSSLRLHEAEAAEA